MLRSLSNYEMRLVTGRTLSGVTHEGWDPVQARKVSITIVPCRDADEPARLAWAGFLRDVTAAAALNHRNVVRILDHGESGRTAYIVTEWSDGQPLDALLAGGARPSQDGVAAIMEGVLAGLQHGHDHGLVHGDVTPSSVLLSAEGTPGITGYGGVHLKRDEMSRPGAAADAAAYMAPEQLRGAPLSPAVDVYAAGVMLHQMLLGRLPFEGRTAPLAQEVVSARLVLPSSGLDDVPGLTAVLTRALAKLPSERYGSAQEFARALRASFSLASAVAPRQPAVLSDLQTLLTRPDPDAPLATAPAVAGTGERKGGRSGLLVIPALAAVAGLAALGWWASGQRVPALPLAAQATVAAPTDPAAADTAPALSQDAGLALMPYPVAGTRPVPAAAAPDTGTALAASLNDAAAGLPCTLLAAEPGTDGVAVRGLTALGEASRIEIQGTLRRVATQAVAAASAATTLPPVTWDIRRTDGPHCGVLDALRQARVASPASAMLAGAPSNGETGATSLELSLPRGSAALLDLYGADRTVTHLKAGDQRVTVPRGTGLVTLVVSPTPLVADGRPAQEPAAAYLGELKAGLARARSQGERVTAETMAVPGTP